MEIIKKKNFHTKYEADSNQHFVTGRWEKSTAYCLSLLISKYQENVNDDTKVNYKVIRGKGQIL